MFGRFNTLSLLAFQAQTDRSIVSAKLNLTNMKYRKKPVVIEAIQWDGIHGPSTAMICDTFGSSDESGEVRVWVNQYGNLLIIKTLEGNMTAQPGDYIIQGVKGELYPCKPDIFEQTYDKVD
jgi:hypothetical protein